MKIDKLITANLGPLEQSLSGELVHGQRRARRHYPACRQGDHAVAELKLVAIKMVVYGQDIRKMSLRSGDSAGWRSSTLAGAQCQQSPPLRKKCKQLNVEKLWSLTWEN